MTTFLSPLWNRSPVLTATGAGHLLLALVFLALALIDSRQFLGANLWFKPLKFALSIGMFTLTLAWFWPELDPRNQFTLIAKGIAIAMWTEILIIGIQAGRGVRSHFSDSGLGGMLYSIMGVMIAISTLLTIFLALRYGFALLKSRPVSAYQITIFAGMIIFIAGSFVGAMMSSNQQHSVGVEDGGPGLPFLNWSNEGGDLRAAHSIGLHALQAIPLLGATVDWLDLRPPLVFAVAGAAGYTMIFAWQLNRALRAMPAIGG